MDANRLLALSVAQTVTTQQCGQLTLLHFSIFQLTVWVSKTSLFGPTSAVSSAYFLLAGTESDLQNTTLQVVPAAQNDHHRRPAAGRRLAAEVNVTVAVCREEVGVGGQSR